MFRVLGLFCLLFLEFICVVGYGVVVFCCVINEDRFWVF